MGDGYSTEKRTYTLKHRLFMIVISEGNNLLLYSTNKWS